MHELDTWPIERADLGVIVLKAMPATPYEPPPLTVEISEAIYQAILAISTHDAMTVLERRYEEELRKVYPCNDDS